MECIVPCPASWVLYDTPIVLCLQPLWALTIAGALSDAVVKRPHYGLSNMVHLARKKAK